MEPLLAASLFFIVPIGLLVLFSFLTQRIAQTIDIPPLDLVDARKLDDMVSKQVEEVLRPMLQSQNYTQEQIEEILTRTSLSGKTFRR